VICNSIGIVTSDSADLLRSRGLRATPQRLMVLKALSRGGRHLSAEEIHTEIVGAHPSVNLTTVYRTLEMLVDEGIVKRAHLGATRRLYEIRHEAHHHLLCLSCSRVEHIAAAHLAEVEAHLDREHGFEVQETTLTSFGTCSNCRAR
jgi:Fur family ferric uptake transcriptional regulator